MLTVFCLQYTVLALHYIDIVLYWKTLNSIAIAMHWIELNHIAISINWIGTSYSTNGKIKVHTPCTCSKEANDDDDDEMMMMMMMMMMMVMMMMMMKMVMTKLFPLQFDLWSKLEPKCPMIRLKVWIKSTDRLEKSKSFALKPTCIWQEWTSLLYKAISLPINCKILKLFPQWSRHRSPKV